MEKKGQIWNGKMQAEESRQYAQKDTCEMIYESRQKNRIANEEVVTLIFSFF